MKNMRGYSEKSCPRQEELRVYDQFDGVIMIKVTSVIGFFSLPVMLTCSAATVQYHGTFSFVVSSTNSAEIAAGDVFYYEYTLDDSVVDTNASTSYAHFLNLITSFNLVRAGGNIGSWDPSASGSWTVPIDAYADNGQIRYIVNGSGFQSLDYADMFMQSGTSTSPLLNPTFNMSFSDSGAGQTFDQMIGVLNPSSIIPYFFIDNSSIQTSSLEFGTGKHPMIIPETAPGMFFLGGILIVMFQRRRNSRPSYLC
jgi:hypothetical protein